MSVDQETFSFQQEHEKLASESAKNLGRKPRTALVEILFQYQICGRSETLPDRYADSWRRTRVSILGEVPGTWAL